MKKISRVIGKKKLIPILGRFSPELDEWETIYQKKLGGQSMGFSWKFNPSKYSGRNAKEKREGAYEDAKQHVDFYKELVKKGVYPDGTRVKVKRERHSDNYIIEFFMPKVRDIDTRYDRPTNRLDEHQHDKLKAKTKGIIEVIEETAKKYGHTGRLSSDVWALRNYGFDNKGKIRYIDTEVIDRELPSKSKKPKSLERRVAVSLGSIIAGIALSVYSLTTTGNVAGGLFTRGEGLLGLFLFILGIFGMVFTRKKL